MQPETRVMLILLALMTLALLSFAAPVVACYMENGGAYFYASSGCTINVNVGGALVVDAGATETHADSVTFTGPVTMSNSVSVPNNVYGMTPVATATAYPQILSSGASGKRMVCSTSSQTITGTGTIAHGLSTPMAVFAEIAANPVGNYNIVTHTNSTATVTLKVWGLVAQTPVAATTPVAVDWCVYGTP